LFSGRQSRIRHLTTNSQGQRSTRRRTVGYGNRNLSETGSIVKTQRWTMERSTCEFELGRDAIAGSRQHQSSGGQPDCSQGFAADVEAFDAPWDRGPFKARARFFSAQIVRPAGRERTVTQQS